MAQEEPKVEAKTADTPKPDANKDDMIVDDKDPECPTNARGWDVNVPTMNMGKDSAIPYPYNGSNCRMALI